MQPVRKESVEILELFFAYLLRSNFAEVKFS